MPVLHLECQDCGNQFRSLVLAGTKPPEEWDCSKCGGRRVERLADVPLAEHPWERRPESRHGYGCMCCF